MNAWTLRSSMSLVFCLLIATLAAVLILTLFSTVCSGEVTHDRRSAKLTPDEKRCTTNLIHIGMIAVSAEPDLPVHPDIAVSEKERKGEDIVSAEKVLEAFLKEQGIPPQLLVCPGLVIYGTPRDPKVKRYYERWGCGYNAWALTQREWKIAKRFRWMRSADGESETRTYGFPFIWDKSPKNHKGTVCFSTLQSGTSRLSLAGDEFDAYLKAAKEYISSPPECPEEKTQPVQISPTTRPGSILEKEEKAYEGLEGIVSRIGKGDTSAVGSLVDWFDKEGRAVPRARAMISLVGVRDPRAVPVLVKVLERPVEGSPNDERGPEATIRFAAVVALDKIGDKAALPTLKKVAKSGKEYKSVRSAATGAVKRLEAKQ